MSDTLLVAIVTGCFAIAGILLTHRLNKQDRELASNVAATTDTQIAALKQAHAIEIAALRADFAADLAQRDSTIAWLRSQLEARGVTA